MTPYTALSDVISALVYLFAERNIMARHSLNNEHSTAYIINIITSNTTQPCLQVTINKIITVFFHAKSLVVATYPTVHQMDEKAAEEMEFLLLYFIRFSKAQGL